VQSFEDDVTDRGERVDEFLDINLIRHIFFDSSLVVWERHSHGHPKIFVGDSGGP
jgi:hypothetical protein